MLAKINNPEPRGAFWLVVKPWSGILGNSVYILSLEERYSMKLCCEKNPSDCALTAEPKTNIIAIVVIIFFIAKIFLRF